MSLIGVRDISVIEEPPEEGILFTYVMEYNEEIIRDTIKGRLIVEDRFIFSIIG